jgi:hypothetical protein
MPNNENARRMRPERTSLARNINGEVVVRVHPATPIPRRRRNLIEYFHNPEGLTLNDEYHIHTSEYKALGRVGTFIDNFIPRTVRYLGRVQLHWILGAYDPSHYVLRFIDMTTHEIFHIFYKWPLKLLHQVASRIQRGNSYNSHSHMYPNPRAVHLWLNGIHERKKLGRLTHSRVNTLLADYLY